MKEVKSFFLSFLFQNNLEGEKVWLACVLFLLFSVYCLFLHQFPFLSPVCLVPVPHKGVKGNMR